MTEKMKPSGIVWIGDVPIGWDIKKIKYVIQNNADGIKVGPFGSALTNEVVSSEEGQYKIYGQGNLIRKDFNYGDNFVTEENYRRLINYEVLPDDIAVSMMGTIGKCSVVPYGIQPGIMDSHLIKIRLSKKMSPRFFEYIYESFVVYEQLVVNSKGSIMNGLNSAIVKSVILAVPSIKEQTDIADFLDNQCAKIDSVIADIEKQIETLQKYKKSLITEAVTKGLDRSVPMRDSGNSWYSAIPKHWKICRIKDAIDLLTDYTANGSFQSLADNVEYLDYESFARVIRLTDLRVNMTNYGIYVDEHAYDFLAKSALFGGEILVANVGAYAGLFCEMPKVPYKATLGPNMYMILTNKEVLSQHYLYFLGQCNNVCEQLNIKATASAQPKLNKGDVKGVYVPIPPLKEQMEIERYLDDKLKRADLIIEGKQKQLDAMQQCKKSLIYEYVTGKKRVTEVN